MSRALYRLQETLKEVIKLKYLFTRLIAEEQMNKNLITPALLADRWNINVATLSQWRWNGRGPSYLKLGRRVMYRLQDVETFEDQHLRAHTSAPSSSCLKNIPSIGKY
jgi:hypothetical protein